MVNEFGEVPVDHLLVEGSTERTVALPNGCLCCHLRGDLEETLIGAAMRRRRGEIAGFDRVIVETSGLADPGPVAQTLYADPALARDFKLGPIVTVVDAADLESRKAFRRNRARADRRGGRRGAVEGRSCRRYLERRSRSTRAQCRRHLHACRNSAMSIRRRLLQVKPGKARSVPSRPVHNSAIRSFALRFDQPVRRELLQRFLSTLVDLRGADLLRVKGFVPVEDGLVAVQGVRHVFDRLRPASPSQAGGEPALVFITNGVEQAEVRGAMACHEGAILTTSLQTFSH